MFFAQGKVSFNMNGARIPSAAKIFKYRGNSIRNACGQAAGKPQRRVIVFCVPWAFPNQ